MKNIEKSPNDIFLAIHLISSSIAITAIILPFYANAILPFLIFIMIGYIIFYIMVRIGGSRMFNIYLYNKTYETLTYLSIKGEEQLTEKDILCKAIQQINNELDKIKEQKESYINEKLEVMLAKCMERLSKLKKDITETEDNIKKLEEIYNKVHLAYFLKKKDL